MSTYARVIADSISPAGYRLTTMEMRYPRFVHAELMTHRVFSRNSASSRAIPLAKMIERVEADPVIPAVWPAEQRGMQGGDELPEPRHLIEAWMDAAEEATASARLLGEWGVHKSIPNRLLEPFAWHTVVVTSTAWFNFFGLRCNELAEPHIRALAEAARAAYDGSTPVSVLDGQWHLPYVDLIERETLDNDWLSLCKVSSARCARVSYLTQDGKRDFEEDIRLYDRLTSARPMHASPLEHVATPNRDNSRFVVIQKRLGAGSIESNPTSLDRKAVRLPMYGNLLGWHQHRFDVEVGADYQAYA